MKRFVSVLAATAVAAAVAAAITLPAGADAPPRDKSDRAFVDCLRAHGAGIPADARAAAVKAWILAHDSDPAVRRAMAVCKPTAGGDASPPQLVACLRDHGLTPPATIDELKPWIAQQFATTAGREAVQACGIAQRPTERKPADAPKKQAVVCGGDPAPAPKLDDAPELQQ